MNVGSFIRVTGKSRKGKNRINEHGDVWKIRKVWGTQILVESTDGTEYLRWIFGREDDDFGVLGEVSEKGEMII